MAEKIEEDSVGLQEYRETQGSAGEAVKQEWWNNGRMECEGGVEVAWGLESWSSIGMRPESWSNGVMEWKSGK